MYLKIWKQRWDNICYSVCTTVWKCSHEKGWLNKFSCSFTNDLIAAVIHATWWINECCWYSSVGHFCKNGYDDFQIKEELVTDLPILGLTSRRDIYSAFRKIVDSGNIPVQKLVGLATDGAPAMVGGEKGFIAFCRQNTRFPKFKSCRYLVK